ncbi:Hypothetical protein ACGLYG10_1632 [Actinomyces glycerinitolerans]|uniref:Uncharacterized protein n=1 Tax=Actinomyces glycerinitolerans TaxID=1892869 RepID=A0A1M4RZK1_9ACTO|nr:Hypothetical protein ACGLYG10_1632 [Actinomyces glycerinitolerans]
MMRLKFRRVLLLRAVVAALLVVAPLGCVSGCGEDSVAGPYCGLIAEEDVTPIVGRVTEVEEGDGGLLYCRVRGERAVLVASGTDDSWVSYGRGGNNAFTTLEAITGGDGREIPGTDARVFSYMSGGGTENSNAYAYWLEGRAGFTMYTVVAEDADESTVAALEELVIKYAPQVLDGVDSRTADPGRNRGDPATGTPGPEPSATQTTDSSREAESTSTGSPGQ